MASTDEPKSELARYAFGYSDKKPGWGYWLIHLAMLAVIILLAFMSYASACHRFSVWKYPFPQRCSVRPVSYIAPPAPDKDRSWFVDIAPEPDIPLPSLEGMEFPPDCLAGWCERLKGVGLMRDGLGTN